MDDLEIRLHVAFVNVRDFLDGDFVPTGDYKDFVAQQLMDQGLVEDTPLATRSTEDNNTVNAFMGAVSTRLYLGELPGVENDYIGPMGDIGWDFTPEQLADNRAYFELVSAVRGNAAWRHNHAFETPFDDNQFYAHVAEHVAEKHPDLSESRSIEVASAVYYLAHDRRYITESAERLVVRPSPISISLAIPRLK
jgi:hypothetical protein|tara:strand:- start:93141 stop:93722 length:582 start_codon:yes stop_codon:yes gene_type:complete